VGDFVNVLGRGQWGPVGHFPTLHGLDYWKWMEQLFGLLMGLGVAIGFGRALQGNLAAPLDDKADGPLRWIAPLFLLVVMMWENLFKNVRNWIKEGSLRDALFGMEPASWFLLVGLLLAACVVFALVRHRQGSLAIMPASAFGRAQLLFLLILWVTVIAAFMQAFPGMQGKGVLLVHLTFWATASACTLIAFALPAPSPADDVGRTFLSVQARREGGQECPPHTKGVPASATSWLPGWKYGLACLAMPPLILLLAWLAIGSHVGPLPYSNQRFPSARRGEASPLFSSNARVPAAP
jgi:hypothetical protein